MIIVKLSIFVILPFMMIPVFAQIAPPTDEEVAGVTPDNPIYFFDVIGDDFWLAIESDQTKKVKLAIKISDERLIETKLMVLQQDLDSATVSKIEHEKVLNLATIAVGEITAENPEDEIADEISVERHLAEHQARVDEVERELKIEIKGGNFTDADRAFIENILTGLGDDVTKVEIKIDTEKGETKVKIRSATGKTIIEIESDIRDLEDTRLKACIAVGTSELRIKHANIEERFPFASADEAVIIQEFIDRTGLTESQVQSFIEIETAGVDCQIG